jgi:hypothetical protein
MGIKKSKRQGSAYYIDNFVQSKCSADILMHGLFPNAKEITESYGALYAVGQNLGLDYNDQNINLVCVGDGSAPRTAALFAFKSKWQCHSVDPALSAKPWESKINRLQVYREKIENVKLKFNGVVVIVCVHSHANLNDCYHSIDGTIKHVVTVPCCRPQYIKGIPHHIEYNDQDMWTPHNLVKIWKGLNACS